MIHPFIEIEPISIISSIGSAITSGTTTIATAVGSTISTAVTNEAVLAFIGVAFAFGVVKYVFGLLPWSHR